MPDGTVTNGSPRVVILGPGESLARQPFDPSFAGGTLASIKYDYSGSGTQSMTLAFLGTVDGTFNELDLDMRIQLLGNVLLPALKNDDTNLFIGVDLTQWQSFPTNFNALDTFTFAGGTNDALPGFLIGTSEVALGADGYETAQEKTENVRRGLPNVGIGDGTTIDNAILDKDARVGANVKLCNKDKIKNGEGPNFVIRDGLVVIPRGAIVLDGTVI